MKNYNMILIERLQKYDLYHQVKLISMNTGEEILPSNKQQVIEQAKFTYSSLGKIFEKQTKTIADQGKKHVGVLKSLEFLKPKEIKSEETKQIDYDDHYINKMAEIQGQSKKN